MKKGQVSQFIAIGLLVLVVAIVLFSLFHHLRDKSDDNSRYAQAQDFVQACADQAAERAIIFFGYGPASQQGHNLSSLANDPYYGTMTIAQSAQSDFYSCITDREGFSVAEDASVDATILDTTVRFTFHGPVTYTDAAGEQDFKDMTILVNAPLKDIFSQLTRLYSKGLFCPLPGTMVASVPDASGVIRVVWFMPASLSNQDRLGFQFTLDSTMPIVRDCS